MAQKLKDESPFELTVPFKDPFRRALFTVVKHGIEKALSLKKLQKIYRDYREQGGQRDENDFTKEAVGLLNSAYRVTQEDLARIPKEGPLIVVGNHPFGGIEGVLLGSLLLSVRPDVKLMANYLLGRIPEMRSILIQVNPFGTETASRQNLKPLKEAIAWVGGGGVLGVFPAGEVSHLNLKKRQITDPKWSETIARIARKTEATVLPVFFDGRNTLWFQLAGLLHPRLRTIMLPREMLKKRNHEFPIRVGSPIPFRKLAHLSNDSDLINYLRLRTYLLAGRSRGSTLSEEDLALLSKGAKPLDKVVDPVPAEKIQKEIDALSESHFLAENGNYQVYCGTRNDLPLVMKEIGRLREVTFREVGEGTGKSTDLDKFDEYYTQLFVWDKEKQMVVGAYRLGAVEEILDEYGLKGLYTRTLFKYNRKLLGQITPALELGRSFIRPEYQREYAPLHLLWKGIGQYIVRNPKFKTLFGPVSISSQYQSASLQLMVSFLKANRLDNQLASLVRPRKKLKVRRRHRRWDEHGFSLLVNDIDEVSTLIADIETEEQGVPILLKHYLRLGGKLLGFNVDPDFSDVLDGLILVDVRKTDKRVLSRYMGKEDTEKYLAHHEELDAQAPAPRKKRVRKARKRVSKGS